MCIRDSYVIGHKFISLLTLSMSVGLNSPLILTQNVVRLIDLVLYGCRVRRTPGINPLYARLERSCPRDSKNVSYVDVGLV